VLNVTDPTSISIFGSFLISGETCYDSALTEDKKSLFLITSNGLRYLPLDIPIDVHT
jgi:hypothetical protein